MLEKRSLMQLIQLAMVSYITMVLGRGGVRVDEGGLLDFIFLLLFLNLPGFDWAVGISSVLTGSMGDILLECGLPWGNSFLTGELRTGVEWVTFVLISFRPAVLITSGSAVLITPGSVEAAAS